MPESIRVRRDKVLTTLKQNKEMHCKQFEEAIEGWIDSAKAKAFEVLQELQSDKARETDILIHLPKPVSFEKEYEKAIKMFELEVRDEVDISNSDFQRFFLDEWSWKHDFLSNTIMYKK